MTEAQRTAWLEFVDGWWTKEVPTAPGTYWVRFGSIIAIDAYVAADDGTLMAYHHAFGHRSAEEFFANRWRWSVPVPKLPEPPR